MPRPLGPTKGMDEPSLQQITKLEQGKDRAGKGSFSYPGSRNSTFSKGEGLKSSSMAQKWEEYMKGIAVKLTKKFMMWKS